MAKELPKAYEPAAHEEKIYAAWEKGGVFRPASDRDPKLRKKLKPYTIILPPPNVTGVLHTGHSLMITLQDILVRYHRMKGFDTLYLPGTDHAAIATENKVEESLRAKGKTKLDIGRTEFVKLAKQWAADHKHLIENQTKAMGTSIDWTRNAFTMDKTREKSVNEAFKRLYQKDLIYRGDYMVNWCPQDRTVLSEEQVFHQEQEGVLYFMKYGPFELATTRPETMVGDTAVAVHPDDKRHRKLIGETVEVRMISGVKKLPVIADEAVDPKFGTGVVKVTPFHDPVDYQMGQRHQLKVIEVIGEDGQMTKAAGAKLAGLDRFKAREKLVKWLKQEKFLIKEEVIEHSIGRCERCDTVLEPRISTQWFVRTSKLTDQAIKFLRGGRLKFAPKRFERTYLDWLERLHDWCISRQIWFGHPLPAYLNKEGKISMTKKPGYKPSEDTLDTWFSSALWPFSTMGWPAKTKDLERFFPNDVLETGYEIILPWIVRMVLMTIALDVRGASPKLRPPFHTVFINGIVRDKRGRKFSKSLGNGVDPLDMIAKYGTDALRFMLVTSGTPGNDIKFDEPRIVGSRNFANKLWNIARFITAQDEPATDLSKLKAETLTTFDRAILHKLRAVGRAVEGALHDPDVFAKPQPEPKPDPSLKGAKPYDLARAGNALYGFVWSEFADWYVEAAKVQLKNENTHHNTNLVLRYILETVLKLLHPFMPFITEAIWKDGCGHREHLALAGWPELHEDLDQPEDAERYDRIKDVIETIRRLRADHGVPAGAHVQAYLATDEPGWLLESSDVINRLARLKILRVGEHPPKDSVTAVSGGVTVALPKSGLVDPEAEDGRLQGQIEATKMEIERLRKRLANPHYAKKAPDHVVNETRTKLKEAERKLKKIERSAP
jgi:valyl-tRNA synthetase